MCRRIGVAVEGHLVGVHVTEQAQLVGTERLDAVGVGLGHVAGGVDLVVEHHQRPLPHRLLRDRRPHRVEQVQRPVGADRRGRAHRPDHHDRTLVLHGEVQEVGGLLQGVGAVGDDDAGHRRVGLEDGVDARRQRQPVGGGDVRAVDVGDLLDLDAGDLRESRAPRRRDRRRAGRRTCSRRGWWRSRPCRQIVPPVARIQTSGSPGASGCASKGAGASSSEPAIDNVAVAARQIMRRRLSHAGRDVLGCANSLSDGDPRTDRGSPVPRASGMSLAAQRPAPVVRRGRNCGGRSALVSRRISAAARACGVRRWA